jgi:transposase
MAEYSEAFVGIDTSKLRNAVAIADAGRTGEVRFLGEIDTSDAATRKLVAKLAAKHGKLTFCYEAGPTGYGLYRLIRSLGHECIVVAPSLIPKKPGDRVKTNRRDGVKLAKLLRAGELTAVWVPDERHEAMRDLSRAREVAMVDLKRKRQQILSLLLRLGLYYPGKTTWGRAHRRWLADQKITQREQRYVFEDALRAERFAQERVDSLAQAVRDAVPDWSLAPVVIALQAVRGIDLIAAVTIAAEVGDLTRFGSAREMMSYLGLVPTERSTGDRVNRGGITKTGSSRARRVLVEASWSYRHPPRIGLDKQAKVEAAPEPVRAIAWKAQTRLSARYRALNRKGKRPTVVATAIARELSGFIWAIGRALGEALPPDALDRAMVRRGPQGQALRARRSARP